MQGEGSNAYYSAPMDPGQETEEVESDGVGVATVTFLETTIGVRVITYNLEEIVAAHIHCAGAGEDGPVGVDTLQWRSRDPRRNPRGHERNRTGPGQRMRLARHH